LPLLLVLTKKFKNMKKLFLILAAAAFMVACTPKSQPAVTEAEEVVIVDETIDEIEIEIEEPVVE